jgi:membrane fusion protein, heavy metal efflux system
MAMIRNRILGLVLVGTTSVLAEANTGLDLTSTDLDRLGVELQAPEAVTEVEVASGPARVVIPPAQESIVASTVSGVLSGVLVAEGDVVSAGQSLAEIMSADLLELQREFLDAVLAMDLASAQAERDRALYADGIIAERRVLESTAASRSAAMAVEQVRQQLVLAGMNESSLAALRESRVLTPKLQLTAPFAATVIEQRAALGAHIDALDPVYRIADLSMLWLEVQVPQERADRIRPGMRVAASTGGRVIVGEVSLVGRVADRASQAVVVRAGIDDEDGMLRAGQVLSARIFETGIDGSGVLAVPSAAIVRTDGSTYVFGSRDGRLMVLPVEVLAEDGTRTYVRGDLADGVRIAIGGIASLKSVWLSRLDAGE